MKKNESRGFVAESDSFALFSDDSFGCMEPSFNNYSDIEEEKIQKNGCEKQDGTQTVDEKPECVERNVEKNIHHPKRGFRAFKEIEFNGCSENSSICEERYGNEEPPIGDRTTGESEKRSYGTTERKIKGTGRTKQKIQNGKRRAGIHKDDDPDGENLDSSCGYIDYEAFPLKDFENSSVLISKKITGVPRTTNDPFIVEVIIDGFRYKVSKCSIKGDTYIQGLDSKFIVSKFYPKK